jgi:hypothetical protein
MFAEVLERVRRANLALRQRQLRSRCARAATSPAPAAPLLSGAASSIYAPRLHASCARDDGPEKLGVAIGSSHQRAVARLSNASRPPSMFPMPWRVILRRLGCVPARTRRRKSIRLWRRAPLHRSSRK